MTKSPPARKRFRRPAQQSGQPRLWGRDTLQVERMSQEGRGIATREGKIVFVSGALEGEQVQVQCTAVKRDYDEADMLSLVAGASGARVEPNCPLFGDCGGCTLQHWSLAAQQRHKQASLQAMLAALSPGLALEPPINSGPGGFRHRLRVVVKRNTDGSRWLGLRRRGSHDAVAVTRCPVANAAVNDLLGALPARLAAAPDVQGLREIEIDSDSRGHIGLCCYFAARPGERALASLREAVFLAPVTALRARLALPRKSRRDEPGDDSDDGAMAAWEELYAEGELCLSLPAEATEGAEAMKPLDLGYLPGDFTQTHWDVNAALVARAMAWLQPGGDERALDLFSGIGNFTLPLAQRAATVHAIEGDAAMAERVAANARRNGMDNIRAATLNLMAGDIALPAADIAIVDPPRAGAKAVCEALARSRVTRLVYVSCHPATLARDARILQAGGFAIARAAAVDMFPHTGHSEAIVLFRRKPRR